MPLTSPLIDDLGEQTAGDPSIWPSLWLILIMITVLAAAWYIIRRMTRQTNVSLSRSRGRYMRIVDRLPISTDKAILLVQVMDEMHLVGVSSAGFTMLGRLDEIPEALMPDDSDDQRPKDFSGWLQRTFSRQGAQPEQREKDVQDIDRIDDLIKQRRMRMRGQDDPGEGGSQ